MTVRWALSVQDWRSHTIDISRTIPAAGTAPSAVTCYWGW